MILYCQTNSAYQGDYYNDTSSMMRIAELTFTDVTFSVALKSLNLTTLNLILGLHGIIALKSNF